MILRYFNLREQPFGVTPDPRFLYASATHREALASLLYGVESGLGFIALTAKPGMGKTTLLFEALRRLGETTRTVFLFQTITTPVDLVHALLIDLGVKDIPDGLVEMQGLLNEVLVAHCSTGKRLVVVIDESQNLSDSVLEAVRMLSNFETSREKLMQIILCGQPQLAEKLASPQLLQLRQRISIFANLKTLSASETASYIQHRLRIAGYEATTPLFDDAALAMIAAQSKGIPRNINNLCFNALSLGCALRRQTIDSEVIDEVIADLDIEHLEEPDVAPEVASVQWNQPTVDLRVLAEQSKEEKLVVVDDTRHEIVPVQQAISSLGASEAYAVPLEEKGSDDEHYDEDYDDVPYESNSKVLLWVLAACIIVVLFTWLGVKDYRALTADSELHDSVNQAASGAVHAPAQNSTAVPLAQTQLVVEAHQGQSLTQICAEHFGKCRPEMLRQIVKLNPAVVDPDHIQSGQRIIIPPVPAGSAQNE